MYSPIEASVLKTLIFFDQLDVPLSVTELARFGIDLESNTAYATIVESLANLRERGIVQCHHGLWFLAGRRDCVENQRVRSGWQFRKWKRLRFAIRLLRFVPGLRMLCLVNTLAVDAADDTSDIDVLIIARAGRIWSVRLFATVLLTMCGVRRHHQKVTNRICLSFYLDDSALSLEQFSIGNDPQYAAWVGMIVPVYEVAGSGIGARFIRENVWVQRYLPNHYFKILSVERVVSDSPGSNAVRSIGERMLSGRSGDWLERVNKRHQSKRIYAHTDSRVHRGGVDVVVNDHVLKFHESDTRAHARLLWEKKLFEYGLA